MNKNFSSQKKVLLYALVRYAPGQLAACISIFGLLIAHTKLLDIKTYGTLALCILIVEIARTASSQWIGSSIFRLAPSADKTEQAIVTGTGLTLTAFLTLLSIAILPIAMIFYEHIGLLETLLISSLLAAKNIFLHLVDLSRIKNNATRYSLLTLSQAILSITFTILFLHKSPTVFSAISALTLSYILPIIISINELKLELNNNIAKNMLKYGLPILISGTLATLSSKLDKLIIAEQFNLETLGGYAAISSLALGVLSLVFTLIATPLYPELTKSAKDPQTLKEKHSTYLTVLLAASLPATIGMCFTSDLMLNIFLPLEYTTQSKPTIWLLIAAAFLYNFRGHYIDHAFQFLMKTHYLPWLSALSIILNLLISLALIKSHGILGVALGWLLSNAVTLVTTTLTARALGYTFIINIMTLRIMAASTIMTAALFTTTLLLEHNYAIEELIYNAIVIIIGLVSYLFPAIILNRSITKNQKTNHQSSN